MKLSIASTRQNNRYRYRRKHFYYEALLCFIQKVLWATVNAFKCQWKYI